MDKCNGYNPVRGRKREPFGEVKEGHYAEFLTGNVVQNDK